MNDTRFKYTESELKSLLSSIVVVVDTREKKNQHVTDYFKKHKIDYIEKALQQGDYTFYVPQNEKLGFLRDTWFDKDIIFERKASLEELATNLTTHRTRFEEELATSRALYKYLIIENSNYSDVVNGNYRSEYNSKSYLGSLHSFSTRYDIQIMFMPEPEYTAVYMYATMQYYLRNILK